ncbi:unnamed protein product [Oikopleura dioica]|uniref:Anaphase-promoting complex subunit 4 WD40 domain-containing protein n=1 Tax=Oikopleura dioica TaxID=34765 RepID=E4YLJ2_OIKDI|nr:unnamed protein product [Oikopleura dioica]
MKTCSVLQQVRSRKHRPKKIVTEELYRFDGDSFEDFPERSGRPICSSLDMEEKLMLLGSDEGEIDIINTNYLGTPTLGAKPIASKRIKNMPRINEIEWFPEDQSLFLTLTEDKLRIWDTANLVVGASKDRRYQTSAFRSDGKLIALVTRKGRVRFYDLRIGSDRKEIADPGMKNAKCLAWATKRKIAVGCEGEYSDSVSVRTYDTRFDQKPLSTWESENTGESAISNLQWGPQSSCLFAGITKYIEQEGMKTKKAVPAVYFLSQNELVSMNKLYHENTIVHAHSSGETNGVGYQVNFQFVNFKNLLIADGRDIFVYDTTTNFIKQRLSTHCEWINGFEVKKADRSLISYDDSRLIRRWCSNIEFNSFQNADIAKIDENFEDDWESEGSEE